MKFRVITSFPMVLGMLAGLVSPAYSGGLEIKRHESASTIDLVPGAERGTITQPLLTGTIASTGQTVYFVMTDASDQDFADLFGVIRADSLEEAPDDAVETAVFDNGDWTFYNDAGLVARLDGAGNALGPVANTDYSPLKRISWNGETVTVNVPFIKWGDDPGQQILVDESGIDPLIRKNAPSPFFVGNGPFDNAPAAQVAAESAADRYKGGQAVDIDLVNMTVTMKLHRGTYDHPDKIPYYTVFDASKAPPAGFMGVPHAPKVGQFL